MRRCRAHRVPYKAETLPEGECMVHQKMRDGILKGYVFIRLSQLWAGATEEPKAASSGASKSGGTPGAKQRPGKNKRR